MEKIIHQTWKIKELDEKQKLWVDSVKKHFSDYEYKFWSDEDNDKLININYPEFYDFYQKLVPIEKIDFIRYLYIFHFGGVYMDIDVKMNKPLILEDVDVFLCDQTNEANTVKIPMVIDPFFLAGKKGYKFFYDICKSISRGTIYKFLSSNYDSLYSLKTLYKTGPIMITKFYLLNKQKYNIKVLKNVFTTNQYKFGESKENFHGVHIQFNSWLKKEDRMD